MWAHYGGQYRGFCLEFRTDDELFKKLRKVCYTDTMPQIDIVDCVVNRNFDQLLNSLFCTKSSPWAYEKEWRACNTQRFQHPLHIHARGTQGRLLWARMPSAGLRLDMLYFVHTESQC